MTKNDFTSGERGEGEDRRGRAAAAAALLVPRAEHPGGGVSAGEDVGEDDHGCELRRAALDVVLQEFVDELSNGKPRGPRKVKN